MAHFIPCIRSLITKKQVILLCKKFFNIVISHTTLSMIVGLNLCKFLRYLLLLLKISCKLSYSHNPQTNGQTEHTNQTLEQYLCSFVSYKHDDWTDILHFIGFLYNNLIHSSTKVTPFFTYSVKGRHLPCKKI